MAGFRGLSGWIVVLALRRRAARGDPRAQFWLGLRLAQGRGVQRDPVAARRYYGRAAAQGLSEAQLRLGIALNAGFGGPADPEAACMWFSIAMATARNGGQFLAAGKGREIAAASLTPEQLRRAGRRAAEWCPEASEPVSEAATEG